MNIAFLIAAHKYPELLARLVKRLQSPVSSIFVHVDKDADIRPFKTLFLREGIIDDVHLVPRARSSWGTFDQVKSSLSLLREALKMDQKAGMYVLLSGQDYPLRTPEFMARFFERNKGVSFVKWAPLPWSIWPDAGGFERLTHYHFLVGRHRLEYPSKVVPSARRLRLIYRLCALLLPESRPLPQDLTFYGGLNWWNITRDAAECIFLYLQRNVRFERTFRYTKSSDEIFFQTILKNLDGLTLDNNDLRCVFWDGRRNQFPAVVRVDDFEEIRNSGMFFTRKMEPRNSLPLMDKIDSELLHV
jgi:Core-2/I-Branching enzyme